MNFASDQLLKLNLVVGLDVIETQIQSPPQVFRCIFGSKNIHERSQAQSMGFSQQFRCPILNATTQRGRWVRPTESGKKPRELDPIFQIEKDTERRIRFEDA